MRKKLDTRFPAARIKKIMQADEDVGKIAMAVPLLVSKALELFLQDLCDRTYEITIKRGAKTVNSLHLKQCVQSFNSFDFLKDTVNKVPDLGGLDGAAEDKSATKKRKVSEDEDLNDDESRRTCLHEARQVSNNGRRRGRPRGSGRGRGSSRTLEREMTVPYKNSELATGSPQNAEDENENENSTKPDYISGAADSATTSGKNEDKSVRNFDLNVELNADEDSTSAVAIAPTESSTKPAASEGIPGWSLDNMEKMAIDPVQLANLNGGMDEQDEDYDEE